MNPVLSFSKWLSAVPTQFIVHFVSSDLKCQIYQVIHFCWYLNLFLDFLLGSSGLSILCQYHTVLTIKFLWCVSRSCKIILLCCFTILPAQGFLAILVCLFFDMTLESTYLSPERKEKQAYLHFSCNWVKFIY